MAQNRQCVELMASGDLTLPTMAAEMKMQVYTCTTRVMISLYVHAQCNLQAICIIILYSHS